MGEVEVCVWLGAGCGNRLGGGGGGGRNRKLADENGWGVWVGVGGVGLQVGFPSV